MLTLSLLRHAKSSWDDPGLQDFDRPLNDRGREAAPRMGRFMAKNGVSPELVLCSSSVRTRQTLDLVLAHLSPAPTVAYEDAIYLAAASMLLQRVRKVAAKATTRHGGGHDPGMHQLAVELAGCGDPEHLRGARHEVSDGRPCRHRLRRAGLVQGEPGAGQLRIFMTPKRLVLACQARSGLADGHAALNGRRRLLPDAARCSA